MRTYVRTDGHTDMM
jgi:hypothetical protein